jgi:hypothetical protein
MGAPKPVLNYARPSGFRSASLGLTPGFIAHCASAGVGAVLLLYSLSHDWSWEVFLALPVGIAILLAQAFLAFGGWLTVLCNRRAFTFSEWWLPVLVVSAGPLGTAAGLWHAFSSAHGC